MKPALVALLVVSALFGVGCANNADTKVPQVEKSGNPHPPGVEGGASRPE